MSFFFLGKMSTYEENESKFLRKAKENPFVPVGEYLYWGKKGVQQNFPLTETMCSKSYYIG